MIRGKIDPPHSVFIIGIDEESYRALGLSSLRSFPRKYIAEAFRKLRDYEVKLLIFDFVLIGESADPEGDQALADEMKKIPTIVASFYSREQATDAFGNRSLKEIRIEPMKKFVDSAIRVASFAVTLHDGIAQRFPVRRSYLPRTPLVDVVAGLMRKEPPDGNDFVNYYGDSRTIRSIPIQTLLKDESGQFKNVLRGGIVFVGIQRETGSPKASKDSFPTSFSEGLVFGVEIFANMIGNLLNHEWISRSSMRMEILWLNLVGFALTFIVVLLPPLRGLPVLIGSIVCWAGISYTAFLHHHFVPGALLMLIILPLAYLLSTIHYYLILRRTFRRFESLIGPNVGSR